MVPDFEFLCREYFKSLEIYTGNDVDSGKHESSIAEIIEQCVRRESYGTRHQPKARRFIENLLLGDARKRGETHQWMYDRVNLKCILEQAGFMEVHIHTFDTSAIPNWNDIALDQNDIGEHYKPGSLYIEAVKL